MEGDFFFPSSSSKVAAAVLCRAHHRQTEGEGRNQPAMIKPKFSTQVQETKSFFFLFSSSVGTYVPSTAQLHLEMKTRYFTLLWEVAVLSKSALHGFAVHRLRPQKQLPYKTGNKGQIPSSTYKC